MKTHILIALCIALIAAAPLTYPGPLQTHAGFAPLYALMGEPLAASQMGVLPLALVRALTTAGVAPLMALKLLDGLAFALGVLGAFLLARRWYGDAAGLTVSALYSHLPYRLMTTYIRGESGEALFWGVAPWLLLPFASRTKRDSALFATIWLAVTLVVAYGVWRLCVPHAPDLTQAQAYLFQLFSARWGDGSQGNWLDAVPLQLGIAPVGLSAIALAMRRERRAVVLAATAALCGVLSIMPFSLWWQWPLALNAPWQLLGVAGLCLSLVGGSLAAHDERAPDLPTLAAIITLIVLASYTYLTPRGIDYTPSRPPLARFGEQALLVDADTPAIQAGATVTVTLMWQGVKPFAHDYQVFVHALDANGKLWAQRDRAPMDGARPTRSWQRGEFLRDEYALKIPTDAPPGLVIAVGMYRLDTGERLQTADGPDRVILTR